MQIQYSKYFSLYVHIEMARHRFPKEQIFEDNEAHWDDLDPAIFYEMAETKKKMPRARTMTVKSFVTRLVLGLLLVVLFILVLILIALLLIILVLCLLSFSTLIYM